MEIGRTRFRELLADAQETTTLRNLLRDIYDVVKSGEQISEGLLSRIRTQMATGQDR